MWRREQYVTEKYLTLYFNADKESARVRFILSANVVGLGTLIDEYVDLEGSTTIARIVEDRLGCVCVYYDPRRVSE